MGYFFINFYWLLTFLCIYFFIYLVFLIYLENSFWKPLQIPQIDHSHGASIIPNLSRSKKQHVFGFYSCCYWLMFSIVCICVFIHSLIWLSFYFFLNPSVFECFLMYSLHWIVSIYYLSLCLVYFSSIHYSTYFWLYFVLFLDLSMYLSINLLVVDFLIHLLLHLFDVHPLSTKFFLQTPPDFTDRIFRWSIHHSEPL